MRAAILDIGRWSFFSTERTASDAGSPSGSRSWTCRFWCEPVLSRGDASARAFLRAQDALFGLLANGALTIAFHIDEHISALRKLHQKYRDRPMSLADACIVRMAEIYERHAVLTLDSDFSVYRKHGRGSTRAYSSGAGVNDRDHTSLCGIDAPQNPTWLSSDLSVSDRLERKQRLHDLSP